MAKPGEVATALFVYADHAGAKRRPVLAASSEEYNSEEDFLHVKHLLAEVLGLNID